MMCQKFLLANLSECDKVKDVLLESFPDGVYDLNPNLLLITDNTKTTADIANLVDFKNQNVGNGIIIRFEYYSGFFDTELWEWIETKVKA